MVWKETHVMDERMRFVLRAREGSESLSDLCRQFGISRKTGYKWLGRYEAEGPSGLSDRSRMPLSNSRAVPLAQVDRLLWVRRRWPRWGPRKVRAWLMAQEPETAWPAASTIGELFDRQGLTVPRRRRRRPAPGEGGPLGDVALNDVWCIDFKGWFLTEDGTQVEPLTLSEAASRYLLHCQAVGRPDGAHVWAALERCFLDYGRPHRLRSDNGPPFAGLGAGGLSRLAVKVIKAGVVPERIAPGRPQQNGRHERLHLTLKQETASPPARSLRAQMERFAAFQRHYNEERPHEALGQVPPARLWRPSTRHWDGVLREPDYPAGCTLRRVRSSGEINWRGRLLFVSQVLAGEMVALEEVAEDTWLLKYGPLHLITLKGRQAYRPGRAPTLAVGAARRQNRA